VSDLFRTTPKCPAPTMAYHHHNSYDDHPPMPPPPQQPQQSQQPPLQPPQQPHYYNSTSGASYPEISEYNMQSSGLPGMGSMGVPGMHGMPPGMGMPGARHPGMVPHGEAPHLMNTYYSHLVPPQSLSPQPPSPQPPMPTQHQHQHQHEQTGGNNMHQPNNSFPQQLPIDNAMLSQGHSMSAFAAHIQASNVPFEQYHAAPQTAATSSATSTTSATSATSLTPPPPGRFDTAAGLAVGYPPNQGSSITQNSRAAHVLEQLATSSSGQSYRTIHYKPYMSSLGKQTWPRTLCSTYTRFCLFDRVFFCARLKM
jgi:hypothetical protein